VGDGACTFATVTWNEGSVVGCRKGVKLKGVKKRGQAKGCQEKGSRSSNGVK
jgi:hypothetical protein